MVLARVVLSGVRFILMAALEFPNYVAESVVVSEV
jgi:hypothetical protein